MALVKVIPVEEARVVAMMVAAWKLLLPVALVKVMPVEDVRVVAITVPTWKLPEPVALVKVMPLEDVTPSAITVPVAETLNWVLEFTCKSMKFPLNPVAGLAPR